MVKPSTSQSHFAAGGKSFKWVNPAIGKPKHVSISSVSTSSPPIVAKPAASTITTAASSASKNISLVRDESGNLNRMRAQFQVPIQQTTAMTWKRPQVAGVPLVPKLPPQLQQSSVVTASASSPAPTPAPTQPQTMTTVQAATTQATRTSCGIVVIAGHQYKTAKKQKAMKLIRITKPSTKTTAAAIATSSTPTANTNTNPSTAIKPKYSNPLITRYRLINKHPTATTTTPTATTARLANYKFNEFNKYKYIRVGLAKPTPYVVSDIGKYSKGIRMRKNTKRTISYRFPVLSYSHSAVSAHGNKTLHRTTSDTPTFTSKLQAIGRVRLAGGQVYNRGGSFGNRLTKAGLPSHHHSRNRTLSNVAYSSTSKTTPMARLALKRSLFQTRTKKRKSNSLCIFFTKLGLFTELI
eukprot:c11258_g1_i4.p1 GENE.c11258_g1_i4~~c11258_g1_i4.p1  ORF type:complete len:410 (+),score=112.82 c11258_g1_i4:137-1366(+)